MAQYLPLPDGTYYPVAEGEDPKAAWQRAIQKYPDAFASKTPEEGPKSGFMPALKAGVSGIKSDTAALLGRTGLMELPAAEKYIAEQEAYKKKTFKPTQEGFTEAPIANIKELLGGSLPYMVAPIVAGGAAAALPLTGLAATAAGVGAAGLASAGQFTGSNLSRQMQEGKKLEETDLGAAALAAIPQAALDTLSLRMLPGVGKILQSAGISASEQVAANYAKEALKKTAADYLLKTGRTMGVEGLTEAGQQVFERMQAGLNITDANARKEYFDSFVGGAVLGGVIAPAGRYVERGGEQARFDKQQREEQKTQADAARVEQDKLDATTLATKQTPEYAQKAQADYVAAEQRQKELEGQIHKGNKLTEDQKQDNRETQQALNEHATVLKDTNKEYRQYRQFLPKEPAPPLGEDTTQLQQRDMFGNLPTPKTPELDMRGKEIGRTGTAEDVLARERQDSLYGPESKQAQLQQTFDMYDATVGNRGKFNAAETLLAQNDPRQQVRMLEQMVAQFQTQAPTLTLEQLQTAQPKYAQAVDALAQAREAVKKLPKPEEQQIAVAQKQLANAETNGDIDAQIALRIKLKDMQSRVVPKTQQEFEMQPFQATSETREQFRDRRSKELGDQRAETLARLDAEYDAAYAEHTRKLGESQALQRIGARPAGAISTLPEFNIPKKPYPYTGTSAALDEATKSLTGAPTGFAERASKEAGETLPTTTVEQPDLFEEPPTPQRGGPAPFKLRPDKENVKAPVTAASLRDRVNQLQLREDLSDEAYAFLRRADASIGENDLALGNEASLFTMLDEQLGKIERDEEGVYGEGAPAKRLETTARGGEGTGAMAEALRESGAVLPSTVTGLPGSVTTPTAAEKVKSDFADKTYKLSDSERAKALAKVKKEKYDRLVELWTDKNGVFQKGKSRAEAARQASLIKQEDVAQGVMTSAGPTAVGVRGRAEAAPAMNADQALKAAIAANPKAAQQANVQRAARQLENRGTLRGESAKAKPLSLPRELETHLRVKEELAQSEKNIDQMSLFPEKEVPATALGRATPGMFRRFLDSKIVKEMREAEARTKVHKQQAPKITYYFGLINELEAKLNALVTESDLRGTAKSILKDNDDVVALLQQYGKLKADPMFSSILAMTSVDNEKEIKALTQDVAVYTKTLAELDKQSNAAKQSVASRREQIEKLNRVLSGIAPLETKLEAATAQLREFQKELKKEGAAPAPEKTQEYKNEIASLKRQIESKLGFGEIGYEAPAFVFGQEDTQTMVMFEAALKNIKDNRVLVDMLQRQNKKLRQELSQFSKLRTTAENTQAMLADLSSTLKSVSKTQDNIDKIPAVMDAQKTLWDLEHSDNDPATLKTKIAQAQVDLRNAVVAKEEADAASKEAAKSPSTKAYEQASAAFKKRRPSIDAELVKLRDQARAQRIKEENVRLYGAKQKTALPGGISVAPITSTTYVGKVQNQITNAVMDNIDAIEKEINELKQELEDKQKEGLPGKPQQMQITRLESALQEANEFYNEQLKTEGIAKSNKEYAKQILAWPLKKLKLELGTLENQANALEDKVKAARAKSLSHFEKQKAKEAGLVTFASLPPGKYPEVSKVKVSQLIPSERNKTPGGARPSPVFAFKGQGAAFRQTEILRLKRDSVAQRIEQVEALERQGKTAEETQTKEPQRKASERGNVAPSSVTRTGPVTRGVTTNVTKLTESKRSGRPISSRQQQLERLQANIDAAQIKANEAATNWKKATEAYEASKGQPAQVREDAKAAYEAADNRLEISRSNLDAAKALLEAEDITKEQQEKLGAVSGATQAFENATNEQFDLAEDNPIPKKTPAVLSPTVKKTAKENPKVSQQDIDDAVAAKGSQIDKKYGTEMDTSSPYHGKTYAEAARIAAEKARNPLSKKLFNILAETLDTAYSDDMHGRVYVTSKKGVIKPAKGAERPVLGHYDPLQNYVLTISTAGSQHATKILLHELLHAATSRGLYANKAFNARVEHLRNTVEKWLQTPEGKKYFRANKIALVGFSKRGVYGLTNTHEFLAEAFVNKGFQDLLDQIPSETPKKSVLSRLVDTFAGFLRFSKPEERSLLNDVLEITEEAFTENKPLNEMQRWRQKALLEAEDITKEQREKLGLVSESTQEFAAATGARPLLSRGPTKNPSTSASVKAELKEYFPDLGRVKIYDTVDALVKANPQYKTLIPSDARGFVDTAGNKAFLIAENIDQGQALGVLLHEIGAHVGLKSILGENQYNALVNVVGVWAKKNDGSLESRVAKSALARVKEAETEAKHQDDETLAYAIEEAVKAGIKPSQAKSVLGTWLGRIANAFRKLLTKFGMNPETLNAQGLVDMAFGAAQMEMQPAPTGMSRRMFLRGAVAAVGGMKLPAVKTGLSLEAKAELFNATLDAADAWFNTVVGMAKTPALRGMLKEYSFDIDYDVFAEALYNMDSDVEGVESLYSHLHWESYGNGDSTESLLALLRSKPDAIEKLQGAIFDVRSQLMSMIDKLPKKENGEIAENELPEVGELLFSRKADYKSDDALTRLAKKAVAQDKTYKERAGSHIGLQIEMAAADMRAGVIKALNNAVEDPKTMGSTKLFRQAIFSITAADQAMSTTQMSLSVGPPKMVKDAKGYYSVNSSMENDAGQVFDAVQDIPDSYGNAEAKMGLASIYMIAQRALNKGLKKLDIGALGIETEQELIDAMAVANADPKLKAALENVRKKYNAYNRGMIEWLSSPQVAAISQADAKAYLKDEDYVPYYRVRADGTAELVFGGEKTITIGDIRHQPYLAELKGGEAKIMPLDKSIMRNTMLLVTKGMNNMAMKNVGYAMQAAGDGLGPIGKNGKPTNLMPIFSGKGPDQANVIRWTQEPDPSKPDDKGDRYLRVETNGTLFGGIPAELIIKSLDGAHLTLPAFLKWGGIAGDLLRSGITRTPIYLARQLFRDPFAATATSGLDYGPITAIFKATKEFLKIAAGKSETGAKMIEKGLLQSGLFEGDITNMSKIALQLASGKSQGVIDRVLAGADRLALQADAATRTLIYDNAIKNGLSEAEADYAVRESMNFSKRGLSPTVQYASRLIPFFNAQIQGLSVLVKAATGNMPSEDVLKIKRKFANNAMMLTGFGLAYAMAMDDDEYYKNAKPRDRYSNFFIPLPGVDEPLKLPIPYEFGFFFSAGVALADSIKGEVDTPQQLRAIKDMFVGAIPGASGNFVPQIVKPLAEVYANRNFFSGTPLESSRLEKLAPEARYNAHTTEVAKWMATMVPGLSPIQIEHIVSGYLGQIPLMVLASTNEMFRDGKEEPTRKLSEMPLIGSSFQRKYGGEDADVVYKLANDSMEAKRTFDSYRKTGKLEDAKEFLADNRAEIMVAPMAAQYQKLMGTLRKQEEIIRGSNMPPDAKEKRIDALNAQRQLQSERYLKAIRRAEAASGRTTPQ